jgi:1-deoxy-D-xylulose-5-phosphate reductoisomerase
MPADRVLAAMVGAAGLRPLLSAIDAGNDVAVANKEPFVMAGRLLMERARDKAVTLLPVDSEHSAIFQCLKGNDAHEVAFIHLTASGGPFYGRERASLTDITPAQASRHPTWDMGAKVSVDSATLMNKGLEIIEAMWLFGLPPQQIDVVIHPQSIVHSLVEFKDGNILAHLGVTDMRFPILYALGYPVRADRPMERLNLKELGTLTFAAPDFENFPCLAHARDAARRGGTAPAILNAANERAVAAFCDGHIPFLRISDVVEGVRSRCPGEDLYDLDSVIDADREARTRADELITSMGTL